jgi:hypothetical protein
MDSLLHAFVKDSLDTILLFCDLVALSKSLAGVLLGFQQSFLVLVDNTVALVVFEFDQCFDLVNSISTGRALKYFLD